MDDSNFRLPPQQWALLRRLLDEALDLPSTQRSAWLAALPAEHATLAPRLEALLSHADAPTVLQTVPRRTRWNAVPTMSVTDSVTYEGYFL